MAYVTFYSDSEEFLMGVCTGACWANDSSIDFDEDVIKSDNDKYQFMLVAHDGDATEHVNKFFNGASFDYQDITGSIE